MLIGISSHLQKCIKKTIVFLVSFTSFLRIIHCCSSCLFSFASNFWSKLGVGSKHHKCIASSECVCLFFFFFWLQWGSLIGPSQKKFWNSGDYPTIRVLTQQTLKDVKPQYSFTHLYRFPRGQPCIWDKVRCYWEHVTEHIGNLVMNNKKIPTPPPIPHSSKKKNWIY
jgi:hypothetical protein